MGIRGRGRVGGGRAFAAAVGLGEEDGLGWLGGSGVGRGWVGGGGEGGHGGVGGGGQRRYLSGPHGGCQISCIGIGEGVSAHLEVAHLGRGQWVGASARPFLFVADGKMGGVNGDGVITESNDCELGIRAIAAAAISMADMEEQGGGNGGPVGM